MKLNYIAWVSCFSCQADKRVPDVELHRASTASVLTMLRHGSPPNAEFETSTVQLFLPKQACEG